MYIYIYICVYIYIYIYDVYVYMYACVCNVNNFHSNSYRNSYRNSCRGVYPLGQVLYRVGNKTIAITLHILHIFVHFDTFLDSAYIFITHCYTFFILSRVGDRPTAAILHAQFHCCVFCLGF